jgi:anti-sigma factor RsiW
MNRHLEEHEITTAVAGLELDARFAEHLGTCVSCRERVAAMREAIEERRRDLEAEAPNWEQQREDILRRLPSTPTERPSRRRSWTRPLLALAAVVVVAIGLRVLWTPGSPPEPPVGAELPVEEILAEVDAVLDDESIPGFELIDPGLEVAIYENGTS